MTAFESRLYQHSHREYLRYIDPTKLLEPPAPDSLYSIRFYLMAAYHALGKFGKDNECFGKDNKSFGTTLPLAQQEELTKLYCNYIRAYDEYVKKSEADIRARQEKQRRYLIDQSHEFNMKLGV